jgi:group I intron endonuclease
MKKINTFTMNNKYIFKLFIVKNIMESGIYKIENIIEGKIYVGSAKNIKKRKKEHFNALKNNMHKNKHLQNAWNKYAENNFIFKIIENVEPNLLIIREQYYIDQYKSYDRNIGYNIAPKAGNTSGIIPSEETKEKIRKKLIGRKSSRVNYVVSEETRKNMSNSAKKKPSVTEETKKNLSIALMGNKNACRIVSDEERKKMSNVRIGINRGENNGMAITNKNEIIAMRNDYDSGMSISNIMIKYNKKNSFTYQIVKRLRWNWLT